MTLVRFKKTSERAKMPTYATDGSCGADLYAVDGQMIFPGETIVVDTGIAIELPYSCVGFVLPRSGMTRRQVPAEVGTIDSDYRGAVGVMLTNHSPDAVRIVAGERIGQLVIAPVVRARFVEAEELGGTARGTKGFGSSGR